MVLPHELRNNPIEAIYSWVYRAPAFMYRLLTEVLCDSVPVILIECFNEPYITSIAELSSSRGYSNTRTLG